jgi:hypothetical protein
VMNERESGAHVLDGATADGDLAEVGMPIMAPWEEAAKRQGGSPPRCSRARRMKLPASKQAGSTKARRVGD